MLFSVYSLPNIFIPLVCGCLIASVGTNKVMIITSFLVVIGQFVFFYGNLSKTFVLLLLGRFIFGIGREVLGIASYTTEATWFRGKELSFAMSIDFFISNVAAFAVCSIEPIIYTRTKSLVFTNLIGCVICCISLVMSFVVYSWESRRLAEVAEAKKLEKERKSLIESSSVNNTTIASENEHSTIVNPNSENDNEEAPTRITDIIHLSRQFWLLCFVFALGWFPSYMFARTCSEFYQAHYGFDITTAGTVMGLELLVMALTIPFTGWFVDKYGNNIIIAIASTLAYTVAFGFLYFVGETLYGAIAGIFVLGVNDAFFTSAVWPAISYFFYMTTK